MAAAFFLYAATGVVAPWWAVLLLLVLRDIVKLQILYETFQRAHASHFRMFECRILHLQSRL